MSNTVPLFLVILLVACYGCSRVQREGGKDQDVPGMTIEDYDQRMRRAKTEPEAWALTYQQLKHWVDSGHTVAKDPLDLAKQEIVQYGGRVSDFWVDAYQDVLLHLELGTGDLYALSKALESNYKLTWDTEVDGLRVYHATRNTQGEMAQKWLFRMTGRDFHSRREFEEWFLLAKDILVWVREEGRFAEVRSIESSP